MCIFVYSLKEVKKMTEKFKAVRLSHETLLKLKFLSLSTKRSMSSLLTEFIDSVFQYALNWKDCQLWYDCSNNQVLITIAGKRPLLLVGMGEEVQNEIKKRVEEK
jgi:hypothetical protein